MTNYNKIKNGEFAVVADHLIEVNVRPPILFHPHYYLLATFYFTNHKYTIFDKEREKENLPEHTAATYYIAKLGKRVLRIYDGNIYEYKEVYKDRFEFD